ncbi:uncharacterized protein LOC135221864 [Macrobrachium nipponense]|uniref:uncharacterized protein LOC135221864 n=1 Tax=Macrobrachium nipponense TaxID=159736 RepID=UPI0030C7B56F
MDEVKVTDGIDSSKGGYASTSSPLPVYHRKRGRPRKGTYVPRSSSLDMLYFNDSSKFQKCDVRQKMKRSYGSVVDNESNNLGFDTESEKASSRENSKRRRQPKVLDDYVTDFDTSDEEAEKFSRSAPFQLSKERSGVSKGFNRKSGELHSLENEDILSYLGSFEKNFVDQDFFGSDFLEGSHEGSEEDVPADTSKNILVGGTTCDSKLSEVLSPKCDKQDSDIKNGDGAIFTSRQKEREWKQSVRNHRQQLAALQQKYQQLVQKIQKKPQFTKVLDLVYGASKLLNEEQLVFFILQLKANSKNLQGVRFSTREKILALAIYAHSPETYRWLQSHFFLPSKLILDRWLEMIAKDNPTTAKRLLYHLYKKYLFHS